MLFHIAKLAQGTDTAFRSKIQLKYHLWKEKTFFHFIRARLKLRVNFLIEARRRPSKIRYIRLQIL